MISSELDEEIDVPNFSENLTVRVVNSTAPPLKSSNFLKRISEIIQRLKIDFFYDLNFLKSLFSNNLFKQILTNDDEIFVYDELLINEAKLCLIKPIGNFVYFCLIVLAGLLIVSFKFFSFLLILVVFYGFLVLAKYAFRRLFKNFVSEIYENMKLVHSLFGYLKKVHLMKLDLHNNGLNDVNLKFRRMLFEYVREEYFVLKDLSLQFACYSSSEVKLNCKIEQNELNEVLKMDIRNEERLATITDQYHLNTINCIIKLNYLQISELVKLLFLSCIQKNFSTFLVILVKLFFIVQAFKLKNTSLSRLMNVIQLREKDDENEETAAPDSKQSRLKAQADSLSLHLRNAILNSYKLSEENDNLLLNVIEYELEFCLLYLKQIRNEVSPKEMGAEKVAEQNEEFLEPLLKNSVTEENDKNVNADVENVDCIFEALSNENLKDIEDPDDNDDVDMQVRTRENEVVNTKFYKELQEALVKKKDEWNEREKLAKVVKDDKLIEYEKNLIDTSNLLIKENELLKYKSQLRNRKNTAQKKYQYFEEEVLTKHVGFETVMNNSSFLSEFKAKKKEIYQKDIEEDSD